MKMLVFGLALQACLCLALAQDHSSESMESQEKEPLTRCKRPFCDMMCIEGFVTDKNGCDICQCREAPRCPEPMCANDCHEFGGYKRNHLGCMTCECAQKITCEDQECPVGQFCQPDRSHCNPSLAECVPRPICVHEDDVDAPNDRNCPKLSCPVLDCEFGQRRDEENCPTCHCSEDPCESHQCHDGQTCTLQKLLGCHSGNCPVAAKCTIQTLCHRNRDWMMEKMKGVRGGMAPEWELESLPLEYMPHCEPNGDFKPQQCDRKRNEPECWCVDDSGTELPGTRKPLMVGDRPSPSCEKNQTKSLEVNFHALHEFGDIKPRLGRLQDTVKQHLSKWLTVEEEYIVIIKIEPSSDDRQRVLIQVLILEDGETDLMSAASHMMNQMKRKHCNIRFEGQTMRSDANTLQVRPQYRQPEVSGGLRDNDEDKEASFCKAHPHAVVVGCVGGAIILLCLIAVVCSVVAKKRTSASYQFKHKKFENYKQNLTLAGEMGRHPDDVGGEKEPTVAVVSVTETDANNSSVA